ncbi:hypothetical protein AAG570_013448, partial [Ranatra chinensis]
LYLLYSSYTYEAIEEIAEWLLKRTHIKPRIGIICGSGMGDLAESVETPTIFEYKDIPNFPTSTAIGHKGRLMFGILNGTQVMCMQGRFHPYEGYSLKKCSMPVKVMRLCGVTHLIASNAAGATNQEYEEGDVMVIKDHISLMGFAGNGPQVGSHDDRFGPRFTSMNNAYDGAVRRVALELARQVGLHVREGVYTAVGGPNYETVAEVRLMQTFGVDAIGMSTVHEVITARQLGMTVFAFSLISNVCQSWYPDERPTKAADHSDILAVGQRQGQKIKLWLSQLVAHMAQSNTNNSTSLRN